MDKFYEKLIERTEKHKAKTQEKQKRATPLLEIKDERTIPKLKVNLGKKFKKRRRSKFRT